MKCFYHGVDLDGMCSGAIVRHRYPVCEMIPINYGQRFNLKEVEYGEPVFVVDFTLNPFSLMIELDDKTELTWIDHHATAVNEAVKNSFDPPGIRDENKAACELTWKWLFPGTEVPFAIKLLAKYDIWEHNWSPFVLPFQYGMQSIDTDPHANIWTLLFEGDSLVPIQNLTNSGRNILKYIEKENRQHAETYSFITSFEGYTCICCNKGSSGSKVFDSVWNDKDHDLMITFCRTRRKVWRVSLYTPHEGIDCGSIAKKYGGGGHMKAASFTCKEIPFEI